MSIKLRFSKSISEEHRDLISRAVRWLRHNYKVSHEIPITVFPEARFKYEQGVDSCGHFMYKGSGKHVRIKIHICVGMYAQHKSRMGGFWADAFIIDTLFHEFAHYLQLTSGKQMNERGINKKASQLLIKYLTNVV